jgi:class 3 adenylate cyclase
MDPEGLREVIASYQKCVAEKCFGGFVAKYMGDGVLVYFGYPQAHQGYRWAAAAVVSRIFRTFGQATASVCVTCG